jgi:hypothetical protein
MPVPGAATPTLIAVLVLCAAAPVWAQTDPDVPLPASAIVAAFPVDLPVLAADSPERRLQEVQRWSREFQEWKAWFARWHNRREPGWMSTKPRRPRPEPPAWLPAACGTLTEDEGPLADGCRALSEWRRDDYLALIETERLAQTRADLETPRRTVWWEHVHLDALWPMTQSGSSAYGVLGVHVTLHVTERVQLFLAPGAILMRVPTQDGSQAWTLATDWGFSYKMFDFTMPGLRRPSTLHVNLARVWVLGDANQLLNRELYLAGFSLTFNERSNAQAVR